MVKEIILFNIFVYKINIISINIINFRYLPLQLTASIVVCLLKFENNPILPLNFLSPLKAIVTLSLLPMLLYTIHNVTINWNRMSEHNLENLPVFVIQIGIHLPILIIKISVDLDLFLEKHFFKETHVPLDCKLNVVILSACLHWPISTKAWNQNWLTYCEWNTILIEVIIIS